MIALIIDLIILLLGLDFDTTDLIMGHPVKPTIIQQWAQGEL